MVERMEKEMLFVSYNICHGYGLDKVLDIGRVGSLLGSIKPQAVALQEVDFNAVRSHGWDEMAELAKATGMHAFFGKAITLAAGGDYGVGILTAQPGKVVCHIPLPGEERRTLLVVETSTECGAAFRFACTHFDLKEEHRVASAKIVSDTLLASDVPTVLMGDFNCEPGSEPYAILSARMDSAIKGNPIMTFPADMPRIAIDHCFFTHSGRWHGARAAALAEMAISDHRPLMVRTELCNYNS